MKRTLISAMLVLMFAGSLTAGAQCFFTSCWLTLNGNSYATMDSFLAFHSVVGNVAYFDAIGVARNSQGIALLNWDKNINQYPDYWEILIVEHVLNDPSDPDNTLLHAVWATNRAVMYDILNNNTTLSQTNKERLALLHALYLTLGDPNSIQFVRDSLVSLPAARLAFDDALNANQFDLRGVGIVGTSVAQDLYPDTDRGGTANVFEALNIRYAITCNGMRTKEAFFDAVYDPLDNGTCTGGGEAVDSDGDGLFDVEELALGTNPNLPDTDGDGVMDGHEVDVFGTNPLLADSDGDGVGDLQEIVGGTNPLAADSDDDGFTDDVDEFPLDPDTDRDYLRDGEEAMWGAILGESDTDDDGVLDGIEVIFGFDPSDADSTPDLPVNRVALAALVVGIAAMALWRVRRPRPA